MSKQLPKSDYYINANLFHFQFFQILKEAKRIKNVAKDE